MTARQRKFCDEYLISGNATDAAIKAGYSPKTAKSIGQRLLTFVDLKQYIETELEKLHSAKIADAQEVLEYLTAVMRGQHTEQVLKLVGDGIQTVTDIDVSAKERIKADCAEPKSIDELREAGLHRIRAARKGKDSVNNGIQYIQDYKIIIHPRCVNFLTEISNYTWDEDKFGAKINRPIDDFNHLMDAMRYALEDMLVGPAFSFD